MDNTQICFVIFGPFGAFFQEGYNCLYRDYPCVQFYSFLHGNKFLDLIRVFVSINSKILTIKSLTTITNFYSKFSGYKDMIFIPNKGDISSLSYLNSRLYSSDDSDFEAETIEDTVAVDRSKRDKRDETEDTNEERSVRRRLF